MKKNLLRKGTIKRIHVDQHIIRQCRTDGQKRPALTVQTSAGPLKATEVEIHGPSKLVQSLDKPLSCGARIWIETTSKVSIKP